jgi:flagellar basal body-associated protein FliL
MKNQFTSFENDYRNEVFNQSLDLDADFLSDLEKRLEEPKRKKKGLLFWWIFGASTLCTFVVYGMLQFRLGLNESWFNASIQTHKKQGSETARVSNPKSQTTEKIKGQTSKPMFSMSSVSDNSDRYAYQHLESTVFSNHSLPLYTGNPENVASDTSRVTLTMKRLNELFISLLMMPNLTVKRTSILVQARERRLELEIYSGLNFTRSYLYSDFNLVSSYDVMLTQSESLLKTKNLGLNLYTYAGNFQWGIGAFITSLGEQADFKYVDALIQVDPSNLNQFDTTYIDKTYTDQNKYTFVQVPVSIGYQFQWEKFSLTPRYSASFGTRFKEQIGYYPSRSGIGLESFFVPKWNFQQSLQLEFRTGFKQTFISFTPYLNFNSVKTPPQIFSYRKYINFGFNVGLGFKIK